MASKLTSSLRKSLSAEKQSVEDKQAGIEEVAVIKPKAVATKPAPAKPATPRRDAAPRAPKAIVQPVKAAVIPEVKAVAAPIEATKVQAPAKKTQPEVVTKSATLLVSPNLDSIKVMLEKISTSNQELSNSFVESIVGINQDVTNYLQQISDVKNLVNIQEVNEKFIASLRQRQQELINKNLELFAQFKFLLLLAFI